MSENEQLKEEITFLKTRITNIEKFIIQSITPSSEAWNKFIKNYKEPSSTDELLVKKEV